MRRQRKAQGSRAVAYTRASSDKQERSCGDQLEAIRKAAEAQGLELAASFEDDGVSGTSLDRPGLAELRAWVAAQPDKGRVLIWHRDRLGRVDARELGYLELELERAGWPAFPLEGAKRTGNRATDLITGALEGQAAEQYSRDLGAKSLRGQRARAIAGELRLGGPCPYGYARRVTWPGAAPATLPRTQKVGSLKQAARVELVIGDELEAEVVREVFALYATGDASLQQLADGLNERGVPSPKGKRWSAATLSDLLKNPVYRGDFVWNRQTNAKFRRVQGGELAERDAAEKGSRALNAPADWVVHAGAHEALVPRALWDACAEVRDQRGQARGAARHVAAYGLTHLIRCPSCGRFYTGTRPNGGKARSRYAHTNRDAGCYSRSLVAEDLERGVLVVLQDVFRSLPPAKWRARVLAAAKRLAPKRGKGRASNARRVAELEGQIQRAVGNMGLLSGEAAELLARQIGAWQAALAELRAQGAEEVPVTIDPIELADEACELAHSVASVGLELPPARRRRLYAMVVESVEPSWTRLEREGKRALNRFDGARVNLVGSARGLLALGVARAR